VYLELRLQNASPVIASGRTIILIILISLLTYLSAADARRDVITDAEREVEEVYTEQDGGWLYRIAPDGTGGLFPARSITNLHNIPIVRPYAQSE